MYKMLSIYIKITFSIYIKILSIHIRNIFSIYIKITFFYIYKECFFLYI